MKTSDEANSYQCPLLKALCLGSYCMLWRWMYTGGENAPGYCGLGGNKGLDVRENKNEA